jgi:hypothetical protein
MTTAKIDSYIARLQEADRTARAEGADYKATTDLGQSNDLTELPPRSEPLLSEYPPDEPGLEPHECFVPIYDWVVGGPNHCFVCGKIMPAEPA